MDQPSIRDPRILEALEVCRPGSDDVADPALRELAEAIESIPEIEGAYERLQSVDAKIAVAFADVPLPEGLERRILDRLAGARREPSIPLEGLVPPEAVTPAGVAQVPPAAVADVPRQGPRRSRRWLVAAGGVSAVAAAVVAMVLFMGDRGPQYTRAQVLDEAIRFFQQETSEAGRKDAPPSDYPLSPAVAHVPAVQWRWISDLLARRGVAYDLRVPRGVQATLYVLKCQVPGVAAGPARFPQHTTGGCSVEAWQQGELLYVLVVKPGDPRVYQQLIEYRNGPLT